MPADLREKTEKPTDEQEGVSVKMTARHGSYAVRYCVAVALGTTFVAMPAIADDAQPSDLLRPGHTNPLRARDGGVLVRAGHTEGGVDLARLAGLKPAAVICEILNDDGTMARRPQLEQFCERFGLKLCTIADLISYRLKRDKLVKRGEMDAAPSGRVDDYRISATQ